MPLSEIITAVKILSEGLKEGAVSGDRLFRRDLRIGKWHLFIENELLEEDLNECVMAILMMLIVNM
jgi:hypothetical protein